MRNICRIVLYVVMVAGWFWSHEACAQEVLIGPERWSYAEDGDVEPPRPTKPLKLKYPARLKGTHQIHYAIVDQYVSARGEHVLGGIWSTEPLMEEVLGEALGRAKFKPLQRAGQPTDAHFWQTVIFNPLPDRPDAPNASARLLEVAPVFIPLAPGERRDKWPKTQAAILVQPDGQAKVERILGTELDAATTAAVKTVVDAWKFAPARAKGQPIEARVELPVHYWGALSPEDRWDWPPQVIKQEAPAFPVSMREAGLKGEVRVFFVVGPDGVVRKAVVESSNNPAFDQPAIDAVLKWRFKPARKRGANIAARVLVPIFFQFDYVPNGGGNAYTVKQEPEAKPPPELQYDVPPQVKNTAYTVYPFELLYQGVQGSATVLFMVNQEGRVTGSQVAEATHPEFGKALQATLDASEFDPARKGGEPTKAVLKMTNKFVPAGEGGHVPVTDEAKALIARLKKNKGVASLRELDEKIQPMSQRQPVFPSALRGKTEHGSALIEFYIDTSGHVLLPRIVSATAEEFGYAAVQAIIQWKFTPPRAGGKPVVTKAQIPVEFLAH